MNKVFLIGNLVSDGEIKKGKEKVYWCNNVAINEKNATQYINIIAFDKYAETLNKLAYKGAKVLIVGTLNISTYEKDGIKRSVTTIIINELTMLSKKEDKNQEETTDDFLPFD